MLDAIADLLTANESVRFDVIFGIIIAYFIFLWLVVCIWVFNDARKRYGKLAIPFVWTVLVFFLNVPMLILYMLLRPEEDLWGPDVAAEYSAVNVPVINFVDENGVHMSLELKIHPGATRNPDMKVDVSVGGQVRTATVEASQPERKALKLPQLGGLLQRFKRPAKAIPAKVETKAVEPVVPTIINTDIVEQPKAEEPKAPEVIEVKSEVEETPATTEVINEVVEHVAAASEKLENTGEVAVTVVEPEQESSNSDSQGGFNFRRHKKKRRR